MVGTLSQRLSEAFLILNVRQSERTTAEEVRMTQMELEQQLGGLFSLLTVEFLVPYLGINAIGRGQDTESLGQFLQVIAQTMGPEAIQQFINPEEVVKRLAAASGIDVLNLVKSMDELQAEEQQAMQQQQAMAAQQQAPQMAAVEQKREQAEMQAMQQQAQQPPQV
jgi:stage V sporulation protein SpoVS